LLKKFYPCELASSVFAIDYQKLYELGYRGIIFDIDNTLVHHGKDSTPEVDELFRHIHRVGLKTILLSNNGVDRIERFLRNIDSPYISNADKPKPDNYYRALELLELGAEQTVVVGDQIFTDILGANRSGIDSILVDFIRAPNETKIGIRRNLEKIVLGCYRFRPSCRNRIGDIWKESC
jgi:HAD superfamily phosphatase (TIGR01668 family)